MPYFNSSYRHFFILYLLMFLNLYLSIDFECLKHVFTQLTYLQELCDNSKEKKLTFLYTLDKSICF